MDSESFSSAESVEENEDKFKNFVTQTTNRISKVLANRRATKRSQEKFGTEPSMKS